MESNINDEVTLQVALLVNIAEELDIEINIMNFNINIFNNVC